MPDSLTAPIPPGRARARDLGIRPGVLPTGPLNAITDVDGVRVGHVTLIDGADIRTGVTAILPHGGNLFQERVPAGLAVGNGFGKLMGGAQLVELGEIETPIVLTNTLAVPQAGQALGQYYLRDVVERGDADGSIMWSASPRSCVRVKVCFRKATGRLSVAATITKPACAGCMGAARQSAQADCAGLRSNTVARD